MGYCQLTVHKHRILKLPTEQTITHNNEQLNLCQQKLTSVTSFAMLLLSTAMFYDNCNQSNKIFKHHHHKTI